LGMPPIEAPLIGPLVCKIENMCTFLEFTFSLHIDGSWALGKTIWDKTTVLLGTSWGTYLEHFGNKGNQPPTHPAPPPPPKRKKLDRLLPPSKIEQNSNVSKLQWFALYIYNYVLVQSIWVLLFVFGSSKLFCFCWICEYFQAFTSPRLVVDFSKFCCSCCLICEWFSKFFFSPPVAMIFFLDSLSLGCRQGKSSSLLLLLLLL
jgi:hypothetical protein